ncbi:MAG: serine hydrolase domain-containing protein [Brevundimonas sp.]
MTFRLLVGLAMAAAVAGVSLAACSAKPLHSEASPGRRQAVAHLSEAAIMAAVTPQVTLLMADPRYQSVSGAVVYAGRVHTFHYGLSPSGSAPDDQTLYEIGSLTKTVTGLLLAQAVLEGRVELDVPVARYLPEIDPSRLGRNGKSITLRHLATHMSGLPMLLACEDQDLPTARLACLAGHDDQDFIARLARVELQSDPGETYLYSNAGARLVGLILESVYGAPYPDLVRRFLLARDGRMDIRCGYAVETKTRLAVRENVAASCDGAGGLVASTADMGRYLALYLDDGDPIAAQATTPLFQDGQFGRAYFWNTYRPETEGQLYHGGGTFNTSSWISIYPRQGLGVFLVTPNVVEGAQGALNERANAIADQIRLEVREPVR